MKELSIEEKAKRYDEAIERAEEINKEHSKKGFKPSDDVLYIFPELTESEDEKIRKALIKLVKKAGEGYENVTEGVSIQKTISWLKEQGNPIDINPSEFDLHLNKLLKQFETLPKEELASSLSFYLNVVQNNEAYKSDENQGEQKPVEWSEEDEEYLEYVIGMVEWYIIARDEPKRRKVKEWLKSLKERVQPQPRQEWSEEDNHLFQIIIDILDKEEHKGHLSHTDLIACVKKLKSLRPQSQWKPSTEQIKGIECAIKTLRHQLNVGDKRLNSLYDDLKKLREE